MDLDPELRALLASVAAEVLGDTAQLPDAALRAIVGLTRAFVYQAADLVEHPDRAPGWADTDERIIQSIGQVSGAVVAAFEVAAAVHPSLGTRLCHDGCTFVDVGTGAGWLAIAVARAFPATRVVGVDILPEALARRNVDDAGLGDRVELQLRDGADLEPASADVGWLASPFVPRDVFASVVAGASRALRPDGWLLPGTFPCPGGSLPERLMTIRTLRAGGHPWTADEMCELLRAAGLVDVGELERQWAAPVRLYAGRRPAGTG